MLKNAKRGSWVLVSAKKYDNGTFKEYTKEQTLNKKRKKPVKLNTSSVPNCGYIVLKDSKIVVIYSNDLDGTPSKEILRGEDDEAIKLVRGLAPIHRWTGDESIHRTILHVPVLLVAYNLFIGSVDILITGLQ